MPLDERLYFPTYARRKERPDTCIAANAIAGDVILVFLPGHPILEPRTRIVNALQRGVGRAEYRRKTEMKRTKRTYIQQRKRNCSARQREQGSRRRETKVPFPLLLTRLSRSSVFTSEHAYYLLCFSTYAQNE